MQPRSSSAEHAVDALIFDLDGTLIDTLDDIADALNRVLAARALPVHDRAAVRRMVGGGAAELVRKGLPAHARDQTAVLFEDFRRDYLANLIVRSTPYPGITQLLDALVARGCRCACSATSRTNRPSI